VGRKPDPERRAELLRDVVAYLLDHGIHQTSLRPLANELGTSTYAFVYHFGSKETLITCALDEVANRSAAAIEGFGRDGTVDGFVHDYWKWNVEVDSLRTARVLGDARSLLRIQPELFGPFVERSRDDTHVALTACLVREGRSADDAFMLFATLTGALADLAGPEDTSRSASTLERMLARVAA